MREKINACFLFPFFSGQSLGATEIVSAGEEHILKSWTISPVAWTNGANGLRRIDDVWVPMGQKWRVKTNDRRGGPEGGLHLTWNAYLVAVPTETNQTLR